MCFCTNSLQWLSGECLCSLAMYFFLLLKSSNCCREKQYLLIYPPQGAKRTWLCVNSHEIVSSLALSCFFPLVTEDRAFSRHFKKTEISTFLNHPLITAMLQQKHRLKYQAKVETIGGTQKTSDVQLLAR